jgi:hypothetical protein
MAYARKHADSDCAICSLDAKTGRRGTDRVTRLCEACLRDPANADWVQSWRMTDTVSDTEKAARPARRNQPFVPQTLATVEGRPLKPATDLERQILLLTAFDELTTRQVAARVSCSQSFVSKVLHRYWQ